MPNPSTTGLPEEVKKRIEKEAEVHANEQWGDRSTFPPVDVQQISWIESKTDYIAGAESEAVRAEELRKENEDLKRRLNEAMTLLHPIIDYGQGNPLYKLGCSIPDEVLRRVKLYDNCVETKCLELQMIKCYGIAPVDQPPKIEGGTQ